MLAAGFDLSEPYLRDLTEKSMERSLQVRDLPCCPPSWPLARHCRSVLYSTVQHGAVQYSTVQWSTVMYSTPAGVGGHEPVRTVDTVHCSQI